MPKTPVPRKTPTAATPAGQQVNLMGPGFEDNVKKVVVMPTRQDAMEMMWPIRMRPPGPNANMADIIDDDEGRQYDAIRLDCCVICRRMTPTTCASPRLSSRAKTRAFSIPFVGRIRENKPMHPNKWLITTHDTI